MDLSPHPILITRAEPGARETAERVEGYGGTPILSPVLSYQATQDAPLPDFDAVSGVIFTSANGVRAFASRSEHRRLPVWCVGPATAAAARATGFETVHESAGNAVDLANFIAENSPPTDAPLLHVANAAAKGDLQRKLVDLGFRVEFAALYEMQPTALLSEAALSLLSSETPAAVLIHSAKGAKRFAELAQSHRTAHLVAASISDAAAQPLKPLNLKAIKIAAAPNEDELLLALASAIATLSA